MADRERLADQPGAFAYPRAGRILVLPADVEASTPGPRPDPGTLRPGRRPGLPARPFRPAVSPKPPGLRPPRPGPVPVAAVPPALDRSRHPLGAAPCRAAAAAAGEASRRPPRAGAGPARRAGVLRAGR